ncbi:unnamed protein product, partial [marine sediment metagenome]
MYIIDKQIITSEDIEKSGVTRISDIFSLVTNYNYSTINGSLPIVYLTSPNGGKFWEVESDQLITWQSLGVNFVKIEYSTN